MHFDNLLFVLLIAMAALLRLLASKAKEAKKNSEKPGQRSISTPPPIPRAPAESDEERIRKFLEALGQPTTSKPPRKRSGPTYQKPVVLPHMPPFASPLPPLTTRPPAEPPRRVTLPRQITHPPYETKSFRPAVAEPPVFEVQEGAPTAKPPRLITTPGAAYAVATEQKVAP